jgi:hypothetical protein
MTPFRAYKHNELIGGPFASREGAYLECIVRDGDFVLSGTSRAMESPKSLMPNATSTCVRSAIHDLVEQHMSSLNLTANTIRHHHVRNEQLPRGSRQPAIGSGARLEGANRRAPPMLLHGRERPL